MAEPREIAGMVESSMGAGGAPMMEDGSQIEVAVEEDMETMPEGVEMIGDEELEVEAEDFSRASRLTFTADPDRLKLCNTYVVTVPTPIDEYNQPDYSALIAASRMIGGLISQGGVVIYESTVYPGVTEDFLVPILEKNSKIITLNKIIKPSYIRLFIQRLIHLNI